ncbi:MAG: polyprenyl synthetase family protein [Candidatus Acididesulfobacter diazotrophicus]|jgi:geranylgeranyl diphosphate synthase type II|uniref:Polyprenyl synthetase family protein n=1 Tax=Candidatus Acididesulfobacter diazotrophicus TaxID=2597226 RepID=A0A519BNR9_9DELT|nr:MAG: polyprenyl synthetase family protein [Candidatus Acididesulfobacter diazotrophicus]
MFLIENYIEENKNIINNFLYEYFQKNYNYNEDNFLKKNISNEISKINTNSSIKDAMYYTVSLGGKRIRPIFLLITAECLGFKNKSQLLPFACSIELIHSYSLIHDDLPAMDNDNLRRGKPTNHVVFGEAAAILAGDALLSEAFIMISDNEYIKHFKCDIILKIIQELSFLSGAEGLVGGQFLDIINSGMSICNEKLTEIHDKKTAALIKAACAMGGILGGADDSLTASLKNYGTYIGLAFQALDDLLDITGNSQITGKTAGIDENNKKSNIASILGADKTKKLIKEYTENGLSCLDKTNINFNMLKDFSYYLTKRIN